MIEDISKTVPMMEPPAPQQVFPNFQYGQQPSWPFREPIEDARIKTTVDVELEPAYEPNVYPSGEPAHIEDISTGLALLANSLAELEESLNDLEGELKPVLTPVEPLKPMVFTPSKKTTRILTDITRLVNYACTLRDKTLMLAEGVVI